jgi:lipooligosaccharide transport system permease protein
MAVRETAAPRRAGLLTRILPPGAIGGRRAALIVERNAYIYRRTWLVLVSGFFEPLFYLLGVGLGVGAIVRTIEGPGGGPIPYALFVAPALLAASSMNGAIYESTFNVFAKIHFEKVYDAILATPIGVGDIALGEIAWALIRGGLYTIGFLIVMIVMGLAISPWLVLALPAAALIGFAFAATAMAATTYMKTWQDFDKIQLVLLPLFLFSGTFYPVEAYPGVLRTIVELTPLYQGVALIRALTVGVVEPGLLVHVAYLIVMGLVGLVIVSRRLEHLLAK